MRFTSIAVVFAAAAAVAAQLTVQTPASVNECEPVLLAFSGGTPPYIVTVQPQGQEAATPLVTFPTTSATSLTWNVALAANTLITLEIRDSTGATQASGPITVGTGVSTTCLTQSASQGSTAAIGSTAAASSSVAGVSVTSVTATTTAAAGATTTAAGATTTAAGATTTAAGATTTAAGSTTTKAATTTASAGSSSSTTKSGASKMQPIGIAGLLVFVGIAALF